LKTERTVRSDGLAAEKKTHIALISGCLVDGALSIKTSAGAEGDENSIMVKQSIVFCHWWNIGDKGFSCYRESKSYYEGGEESGQLHVKGG
jgi:hypothetical protein